MTACKVVELGGIKNNNFTRNVYVDINDFKNSLDKFDKDKYKTIYTYENKNIDTCNFIAPLYLDLDIDNIEDNYDKLLRDLKIVHRQLKLFFSLDNQYINIYFSGSKGFHILVSHAVFGFEPNRSLNKELKKIAQHLNAYTITKCIDTRIYDYKRLFRINNTTNSKTGLFKVQIEYDDLIELTYDDLKEYASCKQPEFYYYGEFNQKSHDKFYSLIESIDKKEKSKINMKMAHEFLKQKKLLPCVQYILQNGAPKGNRNNTTVALANSLFQINHSLEEVTDILLKWNDLKNEEPLSSGELNATILSAYRNSEQNIFYGCSAFRDLDVCIKGCPIYK